MTIGIYKIKCIANNKIYIGSSVDIEKRWKTHIQDLKAKRHTNTYLQRVWNKYGREYFVFSIVEVCTLENLLEREQFYLDLMFDISGILNIARIAGYPAIRKKSEETKRKISEALKGKKMSLESRQKMSDSKRNKKRGPMSEDQKKKISESRKRHNKNV